MDRTIFTQFLTALKVKHTRSFSNKYYGEHPHKYNLLGLSSMLTDYNIENQALKINEETKEASLSQLDTPFIAHTGQEFIIVNKIDKQKIQYWLNGEKIMDSVEQFLKIWNGIILITETNEASAEPSYKEHIRAERINYLKKALLILLLFLLPASVFLYTNEVRAGIFLSFLLSAAGAVISYLLLLKQLHIHSSYTDKICSLFQSEGNCNNILESGAAKPFGIISWSEIGFGYFISNLLILLFFPSLYIYCAFINIGALPYSMWSIWYQKKVAHQWCPLCLLIQAIFWGLFIVHYSFGLLSWPVFSISSLVIIGSLYLLPVLLLNLILPGLTDSQKSENLQQEINSIKAKEEVFKSFLLQKNHYPVSRDTSSIVWGDPEAPNTVTIITNPHCHPCAMMHERIETLLNKSKNRFCIQYILTSFSPDLEESCKLIISMYQNDHTHFLPFLKEWYKEGKNRREEFYKKYPFKKEDEKILSELNKHTTWVETHQVKSTPTVLFNGYELPESYKIEDLIYFTEIKL